MKIYDCIIAGGSYAGLSAALSLARAGREVLIIDNGNPCNKSVGAAHNLLTHDGNSPRIILHQAQRDVTRYKTVTTLQGLVINAVKQKDLFKVETLSGEEYIGARLLLGTGLKDELPDINGFADCWGISVLHCPYCHGYEVHNMLTGLLDNGETAFEFARTLLNWTPELIIFTNGKSTIGRKARKWLEVRKVRIVEQELTEMQHRNGRLDAVLLKDGSIISLTVMYARVITRLHDDLALKLGCKINEHGLIEVNTFQESTVRGVYAAGDNSSTGRSLSLAIASGSVAGIFINKSIVEELFKN